MAGKSFNLVQWLAGIAASVIGALLIWTLTRSGGILNPAPAPPLPTEQPATAPPAPTLDPELFPSGIDEEKRQLITVEPGQVYVLKVIDIYYRPWGTPEGCAGDVLNMSWIVQVPYPTTGSNLEIQLGSLVMMDQGPLEVIASGSEGTLSLGICDVLYFTSYSPTETYKIQIRHAPME